MSRAKTATDKHVTVRMYNVGFGDAFLLSFPAPDRPRWVLVDCGVHPSGPGPRSVRDVVADIIADVGTSGRPRIDVVIATHRHADHISGFARPEWEGVEVGEVWLPWVENEEDAEARRIRDSIRRLALALSAEGVGEQARHLALNALSNEDAMETLHRGFAKRSRQKPRFLPHPDRAKATFRTKALPGVTVHALGPSYDRSIIAQMNPPKGESYLRAAEAAKKPKTARTRPFASSWAHDVEGVPAHLAELEIPKATREYIQRMGTPDELAAAASLEGAVNNTSLVVAFEIGRAVLLFPGDAQWGTWRSILADDAWRSLVARTTFYKVSHHGSHNATLPDVVATLEKKFLGMVSTRANTRNWDIPRMPLLDALRKKSHVVRSDEEDVDDPAGCARGAARGETNAFVDAKVRI